MFSVEERERGRESFVAAGNRPTDCLSTTALSSNSSVRPQSGRPDGRPDGQTRLFHHWLARHCGSFAKPCHPASSRLVSSVRPSVRLAGWLAGWLAIIVACTTYHTHDLHQRAQSNGMYSKYVRYGTVSRSKRSGVPQAAACLPACLPFSNAGPGRQDSVQPSAGLGVGLQVRG
ncbi:hypothetical protein IWZ03DRAFT_119242 [Phyllosticta citriasiana]|uniref:Uncharacterized protein n=1 Tax=Phyllosticta citriasiana TaxID=595635 RepID=A0ABR1KYZ2_9PEZI